MKHIDDYLYEGGTSTGLVQILTLRTTGATKQQDDMLAIGTTAAGLQKVVSLSGGAILTIVKGYVADITSVSSPAEEDAYLTLNSTTYVLAIYDGTEWVYSSVIANERFGWVVGSDYTEVIVIDNVKYTTVALPS
jgi:hypothetical protein